MNPPPPGPSKPTGAQTPSSNALNFSKRQLVFAFGIAGISDVLGAFTTPLPPIAWVVDFVTALLLFLVLGRQWLLLPGLALEATPGARNEHSSWNVRRLSCYRGHIGVSPSSLCAQCRRTSGSGSRHDSKFHLHSSGPFLQVGRVGPVVLHRNWREQVVLTRGTNAPRAVHADRQSSMVVPPVPPFGTTKSLQN